MKKFFEAKDPEIYNLLVSALIMNKLKLICCSYQDKEKRIVVAEKVCRYDTDGTFTKQFKNPVFIEYGITMHTQDNYKYRLHDGMCVPIKNGMAVKKLFDSMAQIYDVFIIVDQDRPEADFYNIYGKIGTDLEDEIVFSENR